LQHREQQSKITKTDHVDVRIYLGTAIFKKGSNVLKVRCH